jgi:hypothetical protein
MSRRLEKGIIDTLVNSKLLGKRKLGFPLKYYYDNNNMYKNGRMKDIIHYPRTRLERTIGNIYERMMPGFKYWFWDESIMWARHHGWTMGESMHHSMRHAPQIQLHAMAQMIHPWGWLEGQRRDAFERKVEGLIPGIRVPDWAQESRRYSDYDHNSIRVPAEALHRVIKESTPTQHINRSAYFVPQYFLRQVNVWGLPAQRLFYNEDLRGDFYRNGHKTESDKKIIHGWYANSQEDSLYDTEESMNETERADFEKNKTRWANNYSEFYPELNVKKANPVLHKYDEPHYERNMEDIRSAIFTKKWLEHAKEFSGQEIQQIYEFFCMENTEAFFDISDPHVEALPKPLYEKFTKVMDFPDFYQIDRHTTYPPEKQFTDIMDQNWGIDYATVDSFASQYVQLIKNSYDSEATSLVKEELFNPQFRASIQKQYNYEGLSQSDSFVLHAVENGVSISELTEMALKAQEETFLTSSKVLVNMINSQVRNVCKTFHFKGNGPHDRLL